MNLIKFSEMDPDEVYDWNEDDDPEEVDPIPCATPRCDGLWMDYDLDGEVYICPSCGRIVGEDDKIKYLDDVANGREPEWHDFENG